MKRKKDNIVKSNDKENYTDDGRILPNHYMTGKYEVIEILEGQLTEVEFTGLCKGLVVKYLTKDTKNILRNWKKAKYYLDEVLNLLNKNQTIDIDRVNPQYFKTHDLEPIDIIEDAFSEEEVYGFYKGIILKYICRSSHKYGLEDLAKAKYYLDRFIKKLEEKENGRAD